MVKYLDNVGLKYVLEKIVDIVYTECGRRMPKSGEISLNGKTTMTFSSGSGRTRINGIGLNVWGQNSVDTMTQVTNNRIVSSKFVKYNGTDVDVLMADGSTKSIAEANGIPSLDNNGFIPLSQLGNVDTTFFEAVTELPTSSIKKHIYLLNNNKSGENNTYTEYIYTGDIDGKYDESKWEKLGDFVPTFDLKEYAKKDEVFNSCSFSPSGLEGGLQLTRADGTDYWVALPNANYSELDGQPTGASGLMSTFDKKKLDGIADGATKTVVDTALSSTSANPVQNSVIWEALSEKISNVEMNRYLLLSGGKMTGPITSSNYIMLENDNTDTDNVTVLSNGSLLINSSKDDIQHTLYKSGAIKVSSNGKATYTLSLPCTDGTLLTQETAKKDFLPLSGGTLTGDVTYGGVSISEYKIDVGNTTIEETGIAVEISNNNRVLYTGDGIRIIKNNSDITELLFPDEDGTLITKEKVTEDFLQKDVAYGDTTITNKSVTVGKVAVNPDAVYVDGSDSAHAEYCASKILVTGIGGFQALSFPTTKSGTFSLTSDIPDISGKADKSEAITSLGIIYYDNEVTLDASFADGNVEGNSLSIPSATSALAGVMSASDKAKLDGIEEGANKTVIDATLSTTSTNTVQNKAISEALNKKASTNVATTTSNGLMTKEDKTKLDAVSNLVNLTDSSFKVFANLYAEPDRATDISSFTDEEKLLLQNNTIQSLLLKIIHYINSKEAGAIQ